MGRRNVAVEKGNLPATAVVAVYPYLETISRGVVSGLNVRR